MTFLILTTTALLIFTIWTWAIAGQSIREHFQARRELRRHHRAEQAHKALTAQAQREFDEWERRQRERDRRVRERMGRRAA